MEIYVGNLLILSFNRFTPKRSKTITLSNLSVQLSNLFNRNHKFCNASRTSMKACEASWTLMFDYSDASLNCPMHHNYKI